MVQEEIAEEEIERRVGEIKNKLTLWGINELRGFARAKGIADFAGFVDTHTREVAKRFSLDRLVPWDGNSLESEIRKSMERSIARVNTSKAESGIEGRY